MTRMWSAKANIALTFVLAVAHLATAEILNKGWWRNTVFYQIYPRSFMDSNGDGVGDLNGITSKLDHFVDAGIGAIWLSPIYASPMVDFGYDISDFKSIHEEFGTVDDFTKLTSEAKKRDIKVILDLVPNHTSDKHDWFQRALKNETKYKNYYIWKDPKSDGSPPNNWISVFRFSAWTLSKELKQYYFHQFEYRQPDLNYNNPDVVAEMEDVIKFWLDKGVDGFRVDAVPHLFEDEKFRDEPLSNTPGTTKDDYAYLSHIYTKDHPKTYELVNSWRKVLDKYADQKNQSEKVMLTEAYTSLENTTKFYNYGSHVPFNFNFIMNVNKESKPTAFKKVIDDWIKSMPNNAVPNWVMGNHDRSRVATRYPNRQDQMTMLEMILPGIAVTYNGEEIGMVDKTDITWEETQDPQGCNAGKDKYASQSRDPNRTPFQWDSTKSAGFSENATTWLPVHSNYQELNLAKQKSDKESHYKVYQSLTALRNSSLPLKQGKLETVVLNGEQVLAVLRNYEKETVTLLMNFNTTEAVSVNLSNKLNSKNVEVVIANVNSALKAGTKVNANSIKVDANGGLVLRSTSAAGCLYAAQAFVVFMAMSLLFSNNAL